MNLRNIDGTEVKLSEGSHKKILFDCDICNISVEQSYRNYLKQNDGKFCRPCRNNHTANRPDVKEKQSVATKERWQDIDYKDNISKKLKLIKTKKPVVLSKNDIILNEIETFLVENNIKYTKDGFIFHFNDKNVELEYVPSELYPMESKSIGIKGVKKDYFYTRSVEATDRNSFKYFIKDFEWKNENKREIMKSQFLHMASITPYRFYARDTEVKVFTNREVKEFEIQNCFYGYRASSLNLGLVLKKSKYNIPEGTLLMLMTFGLNFFAKKPDYVEVFRAGTLRKCQVIGGTSKLFKHFIDNYPTITISKKEMQYNRVVYYVDLDHGSGKSVGSMGFNWIRDTKGGFINIDLETNTVSHRKPMKHKEIMKKIEEGSVLSVPNAGVKVYEYIINE